MNAGDLERVVELYEDDAILAPPGGQVFEGHSATAEVARRQPDGSWRWVLERPNLLAG